MTATLRFGLRPSASISSFENVVAEFAWLPSSRFSLLAAAFERLSGSERLMSVSDSAVDV